MMGLTRKQLALLDYLVEREQEGPLAPSLEEMKEALGLASKSGIHRLVSALVERGYITIDPNKARTIRVIKDALKPTFALSHYSDETILREAERRGLL